jgi:tetratricopeptide (TPR) repeat protein
MQPVTASFVASELVPQTNAIEIGEYRYLANIGKRLVVERGPGGRRHYPMLHAMGGKNVYFFLTPLERGRLQVLPVLFDVNQRQWFDTTASMVRHFAEQPDAALDWRDPLLTFNTACNNCHVSQMSRNYDLKTDSYRTTWREPGINCETCHGPAAEHNRVCREAPEGTVPEDLRILRMKDLTPLQRDHTCAPCHAKMHPLTEEFQPGDRYFDHFGLSTFEDRDFYPDGRDLGENYTYTLWLRSPCVKAGKLECIHCHTSSGRYRFHGDKANHACLPCHKERVENVHAHSHHPKDKEGNRCVSCHMPMTSFSRMRRSDHSMLPPAPAATLAFKSPNACNICHTDKNAAWADKKVREWHKRDYQAGVLERGRLVQAARKQDWSRLPDMLRLITAPDRDQVLATSMVRLLDECGDARKWPVLRKAVRDASPLVRSAAAYHLRPNLVPETVGLLLAACRDEYRIVRIAAANALTAYPHETLAESHRQLLSAATAEYKASLHCRPDHWASHYNLGNYYLDRGDPRQALACFATSARLRGDVILPLVNAAMAHARLGEVAQSERLLRKALKIVPDSQAANFNLALALAERGRRDEAEKHLRAALKADPGMAAAAYNLGVLIAERNPDESLTWCRRAVELRPSEIKYAYTLAFYLDMRGKLAEAESVLRGLGAAGALSGDVIMLLGQVCEKQGKSKEASDIYRAAASNPGLDPRTRRAASQRLQAISAESR